jgi:hypothetical protein
VLVVAVFAFSGSSTKAEPEQAASEQTKVNEPAGVASTAPATAANQSGKEAGIVADVPLFGPTPMATVEPAPLGPPGEDAEPQDEEAREKALAEQSLVEDESFEKPKAKLPSLTKRQSTPSPNDVKPWGNGRMHLPTIHRLRLNDPGTTFKGSATSSGFVVKVPGRKVMESARAIQRRDRRISRIRIKNGADGAEVAFQFKSSVPSYRVRLRKDFVEFLISAPQKGR